MGDHVMLYEYMKVRMCPKSLPASTRPPLLLWVSLRLPPATATLCATNVWSQTTERSTQSLWSGIGSKFTNCWYVCCRRHVIAMDLENGPLYQTILLRFAETRSCRIWCQPILPSHLSIGRFGMTVDNTIEPHTLERFHYRMDDFAVK